MKKSLIYILLTSLFVTSIYAQSNREELISDAYTLLKSNHSKTLLILFPCYPCDSENTRNALAIEKLAVENNVDVMFLDYNQKLFLTAEEKQKLQDEITTAIEKHSLAGSNVYFGGFSSGGNIALLMSNHFLKTESRVEPKGVFVVDSPVDLYHLYQTAQNNIARNFAKESVQESQWISKSFDSFFGTGKEMINKYSEYSPFIGMTNNVKNLDELPKIKVRFYTEPDYKWWKENRNVTPKETNAHSLILLSKALINKGGKQVEMITTENKGYRLNGERHPHSWSIVDTKELFQWMMQ